MTKHELLVPAGDMECLYQAISNGADAVYLGCKSFGARKFARNFDNEEIIKAIKYAHLYGVKIYITMNTLVKDDEVEEFLNQVEFLHKNNVDAIIVQDFGMICLIREMFPKLEIHASTQANTSSKETAKLFYDLGVKRVVFSREMSLDEIKEVDIPIEKEVFIHGALCICYSGCCLMSSMLGTRSGNRGECAGSCRLPYYLEVNGQIIERDKYLLSTKELNSSTKINDLLQSDIASFKIEGRMKSPEYVGFITRYYRNLIDGKNINLEDETNKLKTIFNREFTEGNLFNTPSCELMNSKTPNHIGLEIGKVIDVTPSKIKIKLTKPLNQQDAIRFLNSKKGFIVNYLYDEKDNLINSAEHICYVDNKVNLTENDIVCKTQDYKLNNELKNLPQRKVEVSFNVQAKINKPLTITISDQENTISIIGTNVQKSINAPVTKERIKEQLEKLGNTPFICNECITESDEKIFISIKELNELRRALVEKLIEIRENKVISYQKNVVNFEEVPRFKKIGITALVKTEEQLNMCLNKKISIIYVTDKLLYDKYKDITNIYLKTPRCSRNPKSYEVENNLVSDYYEYQDGKKFIADYTMNISNIYTIYYLSKYNMSHITLSVELTEYEIKKMITKYKDKFNTLPNVEIVAYGKVENMLIKGNILQLDNSLDAKLIDFKNRKFPVFYDGENTHILNYENKIVENNEILKLASSIRLQFFDESSEDVEQIVNKYI